MENFAFKSVRGISFSTYSTEEIKRLSVLQVTNLEILDSLGHPAPNGLYDLRLGPNERDDFCGTCALNYFQCPGHPGHIMLPVTVFNPVFFTHLYQLLRGTCLKCHRLLAPPVALHLILYQLQALDYGLVGTVNDLAEIITDKEDIIMSDNLLTIQNKLKAKFEDAVKNADREEANLNVKSVVECRKNVIRGFVKEHMMGATGNCPHCNQHRVKIIRNNMQLIYRDSGRLSSNQASEFSNKEITAEDARKHLRLLWKNDHLFLGHLYKVLSVKNIESEDEESSPIDMFFISALVVPPSKFRRLNVMHGRKYADVRTLALNEVMKDCHIINKLVKFIKGMDIDASDKDIVLKIPGKTNGDRFSYAYMQLQRHVNELYDSEVNKSKGKTSKGVKQVIEKKEGLFRMNMMGKRVNYAARSVISPDPYIMVNEIGIPLVFAKKLTFPEPVNLMNFERLRQAVKNGPNVHPGATLVQMEDGRVIRLNADDPIKRQAIANTLLTPPAIKVVGGAKFVHRHLRNGDMLLLNRQPSLHKPSILAHKARVLPGEKTLRLHYANCKSYNADFDGDEMNAHFPQSFLGQAEGRHLCSVNQQYLVPKDGTPLSGLIQDHIIAGVLLTMRGRFFNKEDYQQLLYSAMSFNHKRLKLLPPAILKPEILWSGKQVVSSIIVNLIPEGKTPPTLEGKAKVASKNWKRAPPREWLAGGDPLKGDSMSESEVIIRKGELLCGVIDKAQVGPTPYSLIHMCYDLYGGETSSILLTALARLFTHYLQYYSGFSLGIEDIVVTDKANKRRRRVLRKANIKGKQATAQALDVQDKENIDEHELEFKFKEIHFSRDDFGLKMLDMEMKKVTHELNNQINEVCIPTGLRKKFPQNNLQLMIESGAKGSSVNAMQISCLLGQIELEGRRMPLMLSGSALPSFLPYCTSPGAGGFVGGRFLSGINPQEYFFHCMAGREGLIDTAVKTSRSGYLQRCLIKHLEGVTVRYDHTVRDSDGSVIQFLYGEDGMDVLKMPMLKENRLHLLLNNYDVAINEEEVEVLKNMVEADLKKEKKKISKWKKKHSEFTKSRFARVRDVELYDFSLKDKMNQILRHHANTEPEFAQEFEKRTKKCPDPLNSKYSPQSTFGSVTERMDMLIDEYIKKNPHRLLDGDRFTSKKFKDLCYYRARKCLADPGEAVGLLAAQSIGEPSTQMTLNTFHFAGKGEMNVTLGIPRLREILMTASANIATPTMDLPLLDKPGIEEKAEKLKVKLSPVALKDVLESVNIKEYISINHNGWSTRNYDINIVFLEYSCYKGLVNTTPSENLKYIEGLFIKKLIEAMKKKMRQSASSKLFDVEKRIGGAVKVETGNEGDEDNPPPAAEPTVRDEGESSEESEGEGDTTSAKTKMRHNQDQEYEDPEDEEMLPEASDEETDYSAVKIKQEVMSEEEAESEDKLDETIRIHNSVSGEQKDLRINNVKKHHSMISDYDFDHVSERWCKIALQLSLEGSKIDIKSLFDEEVSKAYVYCIPNIKDAILVKNPDAKDGGPKLMLKTSGVNFLEIFKHVDILDINKVYSNNIHSISEIYGIEAAAKVIHKEIVNVFATYGIEVDPRHLSLVADYMTSSGKYRPCNRIGMEWSASPLQQMSFETTTNFMVDALLNGVEDTLKSPSANIFVGQLCKAGTGSFDLKIKYKGEKF